jgi:hypothetical protein
MVSKRKPAARPQSGMSNRNVNKIVDTTTNIATAYTVGMVGIGMLGAIKGSFK